MVNNQPSSWSIFWFSPSNVSDLSLVRRGLCLVTAIYFAGSLAEVGTWFGSGDPASSSNLAAFFRTAELNDDARWMLSPLFLWDSLFAGSSLAESVTIYQLYLVIGIVLSAVTFLGDQMGRFKLPPKALELLTGSLPTVLLWVWFVGWANRIVLMAGLVEPVLSMSLAALAIAPCCTKGMQHDGIETSGGGDSDAFSWRTTLSRRLIAIQLTLVATMTTTTMLASPTWWNGTGSYALIAPVEDRWFDVRDTLFQTAFVYESLTAIILCALPLGIALAWRSDTRRIGIGLIWAWSILVGILSANVLYCATIAITALTLGENKNNRVPTGAFGAKTLDSRDAEVAV